MYAPELPEPAEIDFAIALLGIVREQSIRHYSPGTESKREWKAKYDPHQAPQDRP